MENKDNLTIQEELKLARIKKSKKIVKRIYDKLNTLSWEETDMSLRDFLKYYTSVLEMAPMRLTDLVPKFGIEGEEHELIELRNANKLAHERIKELEQQVAKYDFLD